MNQFLISACKAKKEKHMKQEEVETKHISSFKEYNNKNNKIKNNLKASSAII